MTVIKRSFGVLRFLNKRHVWPLRVLAATAGGAIALIATGKLALARELFSQFYSGLFKLGGRRVGFYLRTGWLRKELADDPFFNFTEDMSLAQLGVLKSWIEGRKTSLPVIGYAGDMMLIEAALAHKALDAGVQAQFAAQLESFKTYADMLLDAAQSITTAAPSTPAEVEDTPGFAENAGEVLLDFERDLPIADWQWFVIGGTFLGFVRDKGFLPHDVDLDVGLFLDGLDLDAFQAVFENSEHFSIAKFDYQTEIVRDKDGNAYLKRVPAMLKIVHSNGINLDVFLHEHREGKIWHGSGVNKWVNDPFGLGEYEIDGQRVLGPDNADHYLREHYGEWRIVVKDFSCITGTTNLAFVKNLHTIAVLLKRFAHFSATQPLEARKVMLELTQQGYVEAEGSKRTFVIRDI